MKKLQFVKTAAVSLACWGMMVPQANLLAAGPQQAAKEAKTAQAPKVVDVALASGGTVTGQVVNAQGVAVDGAVVSIRQGKKEVAKTVSNKDGAFVVKGLKGGVYHVVAGQGSGLFRFWSERTAPPSAQSKALIVTGSNVVRGQAPGIDVVTLTALGAGIAGAVLAGINNSELNDLEDDLKQLQSEIDRIPKSP